MEALRESWTDDRLDDFRLRVDERFDQVDREIAHGRAELRAEMHSGFSRADAEFRQLRGDMHMGFDRIQEKIESLYRTLIWFCGSLLASFVGLIAAFILTQA